jgi:hypothetical protein
MVQHLRRLESLSHPLWGHKFLQLVGTCKLHNVIITAVAVQIVTDFSRQGQFCDCDSIILLPLGTDLLYFDCMTCHSASSYNDLPGFPVRCFQSCWCCRYSWRLLQWWNLPFWEAYCIDNSFACGLAISNTCHHCNCGQAEDTGSFCELTLSLYAHSYSGMKISCT